MSSEELDSWLSNLLANRAFPQWTPILYAGPITAPTIGTVDGYEVNIDPELQEGRLSVRNVEEFTAGIFTFPPGTEMAARTV